MGRLIKKLKRWVRDPRASAGHFFDLLFRRVLPKDFSWADGEAATIKRKNYRTYDEYVRHQKSKLGAINKKWLSDYDARYAVELYNRLAEQGVANSGMTVLCLAARIGTEVKSFLQLGCFAIGIDLNPGKDNAYVVRGDFHDIQFPTNSVDAIFTNSIDHIFDLKRVITEIKRVLKPGGLLIIEISNGTEEGGIPRYYEAMAWRNTSDLLEIFSGEDFSIIQTTFFEYPWPGRHVSLKSGQ